MTSATPVSISRDDVGISSKGKLFMIALALQFGLQPLLQKACVDRDRVDKISLVLMTEVTKIAICSLIILSHRRNTSSAVGTSWTLRDSLAVAALPAAAYALQNWLSQLAYMNLDSLTFNLLNQTKTLFAALCLYLVMGKKQSFLQLVALSLLLGAALLLNASNSKGSAEASSTNIRDIRTAVSEVEDVTLRGKAITATLADSAETGSEAELAAAHTRLWFGVLPVMGAALLSGLCGAVTQRTLQRSNRSASQLSLELSVYGMLTMLLTSGCGIGESDGFGKGWSHRMFQGWTAWTYLPVLSQAVGGVLVGQVTKHAGSVQKGFALIGGILVTAALQSTLEESALTTIHWIAAVLVAGGTYLHCSYPHRPPKEAGKLL